MFWIKAGPVTCPYCQTLVSKRVKYMGQAMTCNHCLANFEALDARLIAKFDKFLTFLIVFILGVTALVIAIRVYNP